MEKTFIVVSIVFAVFLVSSTGLKLDGWTWSHSMNEKYQLQTTINLELEMVVFRITLSIPPETDQWVGLGLSSNSGKANADIVFGVNTDSGSTFKDYYTLEDGKLWEDEGSTDLNFTDWNMPDFIKFENETVMSLNRSFKVDNSTQDKEIKDENIYLIWAYGTTQNETHSPENATWGHYQINLIRPIIPSSANISVVSFILIAVTLLASLKNIAIY